MPVGMCYIMFVALPVHVNDRGVHFVDGVSHVLQLTAQATHDDANSLRSAIIKQLGGLKIIIIIIINFIPVS